MRCKRTILNALNVTEHCTDRGDQHITIHEFSENILSDLNPDIHYNLHSMIFLTFLPRNNHLMYHLKYNLDIKLFYLISTNYINSFQEYIVHNVPQQSTLHVIKESYSRNISKHISILMFDMHRQHQSLLSAYYKRDITLIPHCWDPINMVTPGLTCDFSQSGYPIPRTLIYPDIKPLRPGRWNIVILEPNLVITKNCFIPLIISSVICDQSISIHVCCTQNGMKKKINGFFPNLHIKFHKHVDIHSFLSNLYRSGITPVVISHHNCNQSNYMLYEMIHYKVPLIHTSNALKTYENGLFYNSYNITNRFKMRFKKWSTDGFKPLRPKSNDFTLSTISTNSRDLINTYRNTVLS